MILTYATNKYSVQLAYPHSLIRVFAYGQQIVWSDPENGKHAENESSSGVRAERVYSNEKPKHTEK